MTEQAPVCVKGVIKVIVTITFWLTAIAAYWPLSALLVLTTAYNSGELETLFNHIQFKSSSHPG